MSTPELSKDEEQDRWVRELTQTLKVYYWRIAMALHRTREFDDQTNRTRWHRGLLEELVSITDCHSSQWVLTILLKNGALRIIGILTIHNYEIPVAGAFPRLLSRLARYELDVTTISWDTIASVLRNRQLVLPRPEKGERACGEHWWAYPLAVTRGEDMEPPATHWWWSPEQSASPRCNAIYALSLMFCCP